MRKTYEKVQDEILKDIDRYLLNITNNEGKVDSILAYQQLNATEFARYKRELSSLIKQYEATKNPRALADIDRILGNKYFDRTTAMLDLVNVRLGILADYEEKEVAKLMDMAYRKTYDLTSKDFKRLGINIDYAFAGINDTVVTRAVNQNWSGEYFSDRIWTNKGRLVGSINKTVREGLATGKSTQRMARELRYRTDNIYSNANRVIRTETNYILNEATIKTYKDFGAKKYEYLAFLDERTSDICRDLDGKTFSVNEKLVGTNYPPMHPFAEVQ